MKDPDTAKILAVGLMLPALLVILGIGPLFLPYTPPEPKGHWKTVCGRTWWEDPRPYHVPDESAPAITTTQASYEWERRTREDAE